MKNTQRSFYHSEPGDSESHDGMTKNRMNPKMAILKEDLYIILNHFLRRFQI